MSRSIGLKLKYSHRRSSGSSRIFARDISLSTCFDGLLREVQTETVCPAKFAHGYNIRQSACGCVLSFPTNINLDKVSSLSSLSNNYVELVKGTDRRFPSIFKMALCYLEKSEGIGLS